MPSTTELPLSAQVELWRQRQREGKLTIEEQREIIKLIRNGRITAGASSTKEPGKPRASKTNQVDAAALLNDLKDL